ncbi:putative zinc-binding metallopeptidase [Candidatus Peregrinibacteria bacterium]|nr:putative zinc-binding metallopeptidase [Candidatus Peregrinibacteria bacterium]
MALNGKLYRKWFLPRVLGAIALAILSLLPLIVLAFPVNKFAANAVKSEILPAPAIKHEKSILDFGNKPVAFAPEYFALAASFEINKDSDLDHCEEIVSKAMLKLPSEHTAALTAINLTGKKMERRGYGGYGSIDLQCVNLDDAELVGVLVHEMGHIVDIDYLTGGYTAASAFIDFDRYIPADDASVDFYSISWVNSGRRAKETSKMDFVSIYAMTDPFEDFAETYAMYVLHGDQFKRMAAGNSALQEKYDFMKYDVFFGQEFNGSGQRLNTSARIYDSTKVKFSLDKFLEV